MMAAGRGSRPWVARLACCVMGPTTPSGRKDCSWTSKAGRSSAAWIRMVDFASTDVRFGFPLTVGWGSQETKLELCFFRGSHWQWRETALSTGPGFRAGSAGAGALDPSGRHAADLRGGRLRISVEPERRMGVSVWRRTSSGRSNPIYGDPLLRPPIYICSSPRTMAAM